MLPQYFCSPKWCAHVNFRLLESCLCINNDTLVFNCNTCTKSKIKGLISLYKSMWFYLKPQNFTILFKSSNSCSLFLMDINNFSLILWKLVKFKYLRIINVNSYRNHIWLLYFYNKVCPCLLFVFSILNLEVQLWFKLSSRDVFSSWEDSTKYLLPLGLI